MSSYAQCPHCQGASFETVVQEPNKSKYKVIFVQCSGCNAPVGVLDFMNIGALIEDQDAAIAGLDSRLRRIEQALDSLARAVSRLAAP